MMPLIYFSPVQYSHSSILALAASIKPYGQGIALMAVPFVITPFANLTRRILSVLAPNSSLTLEALSVSTIPSTPKLFLLAKDNTAVIKLTVCDTTTTKLTTSLQFSASVANLVAIGISLIPDNVQEFSQQVATLMVISTLTKAAFPSTLLDTPST